MSVAVAVLVLGACSDGSSTTVPSGLCSHSAVASTSTLSPVWSATSSVHVETTEASDPGQSTGERT